jgi:hypothetical protein
VSKNKKKIVSIKPTKPGFLLVVYADKTTELIEVYEAPLRKDISEGSEVFKGMSDQPCPHCGTHLNVLYQYLFKIKIVNDKVYSYDTKKHEEYIKGQYCPKCNIQVFAWEIAELFVDYIQIHTSKKGLEGTLRLEPITGTPGNCPGIKQCAWKEHNAVLTCDGYPQCLKTRECNEDWRITIDKSKITLSKLIKPRSVNKLFKQYKEYNV